MSAQISNLVAEAFQYFRKEVFSRLGARLPDPTYEAGVLSLVAT
jgi:hypothetical protein